MVAYRSPEIMRDGPSVVSFQDWTEADPLPVFDDDVSGFELFSPGCFPEEAASPRPEDHPGQCQDHPAFELSFVRVPAPIAPTGLGSSHASIPQPGPVLPEQLPRRSSRVPGTGRAPAGLPVSATRKRVNQRWTTNRSYSLLSRRFQLF